MNIVSRRFTKACIGMKRVLAPYLPPWESSLDVFSFMALTTMLYRGFSEARAIARASSDLSSV